MIILVNPGIIKNATSKTIATNIEDTELLLRSLLSKEIGVTEITSLSTILSDLKINFFHVRLDKTHDDNPLINNGVSLSKWMEATERLPPTKYMKEITLQGSDTIDDAITKINNVITSQQKDLKSSLVFYEVDYLIENKIKLSVEEKASFSLTEDSLHKHLFGDVYVAWNKHLESGNFITTLPYVDSEINGKFTIFKMVNLHVLPFSNILDNWDIGKVFEILNGAKIVGFVE